MADRIPMHRPRAMSQAKARSDADRVKQYERGDGRKADRSWYGSAPWRRCRAAFLAANPLCADCGDQGLIVPALHVHHVAERKDRPDLAFDHANLRGLCHSCHSRTHARKEEKR